MRRARPASGVGANAVEVDAGVQDGRVGAPQTASAIACEAAARASARAASRRRDGARGTAGARRAGRGGRRATRRPRGAQRRSTARAPQATREAAGVRARRGVARARPSEPAARPRRAPREPQRAAARDRHVRAAAPRAAAAASGPSGHATTTGRAEPRRAVEQHALGAAEDAGVGDEQHRAGRRIAPRGLASRRHGRRRGRDRTRPWLRAALPVCASSRRAAASSTPSSCPAPRGSCSLQGLLATALLGPDAIGLYGVVTTTAMTIVALRRVGIDEAFVQEAADDEEAEFQRALTVELALGLRGRAAIAAARAGARGGLRRRPAARRSRSPSPTCRWRSRCRRRSGCSSSAWTTCGCARCRRSCRSGPSRSRCRCCSPGVGVWALVIGPFCGNAGGDARGLARVALPAAAAPRPRRRAPLPALLVAGVRHRGGRRCSSRRGRSRCSGSRDGLAAAGWITLGGDADPLRRPRRPDPRDDDLPGDRARARPRRRARGAVRQGQPADADVGVPVRRRARAVRRRPDRVRARRRVATARSCCSAGWRSPCALQQVGYNWFAFYRARGESWPQAVESAVFGGVVRACSRSRARCSAGSWGFVAGRLGVHGVRARRAARLRAAAAAGRAAGRRWRCARRVPVALASAPVLVVRLALWGGERTLAQALVELARVARRARASRTLRRLLRVRGTCVAELRGVPRAASRRRRGLGARRQPASCGSPPRVDLRLHAAPLHRAARRGHPDAGRDADGRRPVAVARLQLGLRAGRAAGRDARAARRSGRRCCGGGCCAWPPTRRPRCSSGRSSATTPAALGARRVGRRRGDRRPARRARTRPARRSRSRSARCCSPRRGRPALGGRRWPRAAPAFWRPDVGAVAALAAAATLAWAARGASGARVARRGAGRARRAARRGRRASSLLVAAVVAGAASSTRRSRSPPGPARVWDALVVQATRDGAWWRLPFPPGFHGGDALKDFLTLAAAVRGAAWRSSLAARRPRRRARAADPRRSARPSTSSRGPTRSTRRRCWWSLRRSRRSSGRSSCWRGGARAAARSSGPANRASALLRPPELATLHVDGAAASGCRRRTPRALPQVAALVQRLVPPGEPIYVAPRRSDLVTLQRPAAALPRRPPERPAPRRAPAGQARRSSAKIVAALRARAAAGGDPLDRPRVGASRSRTAAAARAARARSTTTSTQAYRPRGRYGDYEVLVPR